MTDKRLTLKTLLEGADDPTSKVDAGYMVPPKGIEFRCGTCDKFRPPSSCSTVGVEGDVIYPEGCCNHWTKKGAVGSTSGEPNPRNV